MRGQQSLGRPGTQVIPDRWSEAPRVIMSKTWTGCCTIRRPGGTRGAFNTTTGEYPTVPYAPHHTGACRIQVLTGDDQQKVAAEQGITVVGYLVVVDLNAGTTEIPLSIDDLVEITEVDCNGDPSLVGRTLTVTGVSRGTLAWERDLKCIDQLTPNET